MLGLESIAKVFKSKGSTSAEGGSEGGYEEIESKDSGSSSQPIQVSDSSYGDPNAPKSQSGMQAIQHLAAGKLDNHFYGHVLPSHFKKTSIINTKGRVR